MCFKPMSPIFLALQIIFREMISNSHGPSFSFFVKFVQNDKIKINFSKFVTKKQKFDDEIVKLSLNYKIFQNAKFCHQNC